MKTLQLIVRFIIGTAIIIFSSYILHTMIKQIPDVSNGESIIILLIINTIFCYLITKTN